MWDIVDRYHDWLPIEIPYHVPANKFYPTGFVIKAMGLPSYKSEFVKFYDEESIHIEGYSKEEVIKALNDWADKIYGLLLNEERKKRLNK